ncbi:MAG: FtsL-like putative cell division protein, partial [Bacteroidota bacterium]
MANRFKHTEENIVEEEITDKNSGSNSSEAKKKGRLVKSISAVFGGNFLNSPSIVNFIPFIFFLSVIGLAYIANGYWADNKIRQMNKLTNELKELRTEHVFVQSELESSTNENFIAEKAKKLGLTDARIPPKK